MKLGDLHTYDIMRTCETTDCEDCPFWGAECDVLTGAWWTPTTVKPRQWTNVPSVTLRDWYTICNGSSCKYCPYNDMMCYVKGYPCPTDWGPILNDTV